MGRKLVDMSELEYSVVSTVVVAAVIHYTKLARVARGRNFSFDDGILLFHIIAQVQIHSYLRLLFT